MNLELDVQIALDAPDLPDETSLRRWAEATLAGRRDASELVIRIVDESESASLNEAYRYKQGPTNVLSFPFETPPEVELDLLGDIVICAPVVLREASVQHKSAEAHWAHMVVHGILHLLGYDHQSDIQALAMEKLEIDILTGLGYPDPYGDSNSKP